MQKFLQENMPAILGALIPVLGSVFLIHYGDYSNESRKNKLLIRRACELVKYNMEIAHARIINKTNTITFTEDYLTEVLNDLENIGLNRSKHIYNDLFELVFTIRTGEQLSMNFMQFYEIVFNKTRKEKSTFIEFSKIIESVGIEEVYEFKVLKQMILLSEKLDIDIVFKQYYQLLQQVNPDISIDTAIRYYIVELLEQSYKGVSNKLYYVEYALEEGILNKLSSLPLDKYKIDKKETEKIQIQFEYYKNIIHSFHSLPIWEQFLREVNKDTVTLKAKHIKEIQDLLNKMYYEDENIYLSFIGINDNGDALDNNGRSRQKEYLDHITNTPYVMQNRSWYQEAIVDDQEDVTITFPYVDTSKSYVVSFVKKVYIEDTIKGVVGLDVLMEELLQKALHDDKRQIVFFTADGEIIYDTTTNKSAKKMFFNNVLLNKDLRIIQHIQSNTFGKIKINRKEVYFATILKNKYYCLID